MGARFNQISVDLSRMLNDEVSQASEDGDEYKAVLRTLAINRAESDILQALVTDLPLKELVKKLREIMRPGDSGLITGSPFASPVNSVKVVKMFSGASYFHYVSPEKWDAVRLGLNPDDTKEIYGTETSFRFTELADSDGKKYVHFTPSTSGIFGFRYIPDHKDLTPGSSEDLILPKGFDTKILQAAYQFTLNLLPQK